MKARFMVLALAIVALMCSCSSRTELFNGKDLSGWVCVVDETSGVPASEVYGVKDGNIHIVGQPFGYMRTEKKYGDYTMHMEWRWVGKGTNSGFFHRVQDGDKIWPNAIEVQLCAGKAGDFVMLGGSKISEIECVGEFPVKDRSGNAEKADGEWNEATVICKGGKITVYVNGQLLNECTTNNSEGYIALQSEGGPIEFRNLWLE